jgi:hypothetical protein
MVRCWSIPLLSIAAFLCFFAGFAHAAADSGPSDEDFEEELSSPPAKPSKVAAGVYYLYGITRQGSRSFSTNDSVDYSTSSYSGTDNEPGAFLDYQYSPRWTLRLFIGYQINKATGTASEAGIAAAAQSVEVDQDVIAMGGEFKYKPLHDSDFWVGLGLEYDRGTSVHLYLNGIPVPTSTIDLSNLAIGLASFGYDFKLSQNWRLDPEFRLSCAFTSSPYIMTYEGVIGVARTF